MKQYRGWMGLLLAALLLVPGIAATGQGAESPLLDLLRFVPDEPNYAEFVVYGDLAAWHASWDVPRLESLADLETLDDLAAQQWLFTLPRQTVPPDVLGLQYLRSEDMRAFYGFDLFTVERFLTAGQPPDLLNVVEHRQNPTVIGAALEITGYEVEPLGEGATLYGILEDYESGLGRDLPRVGMLGGLNRIAVLDGRLLIARATAIVQGALEAYQGEQPSLAENPAFRAGAAALNDPSLDDTGELVGAILLSGMVAADPMYLLGQPQGTDIETLRERLREQLGDRPLPVYDALAFGTRHTEGATYLVLAVVFLPETDAAEAAEVLVERLNNYVSVYTQQPVSGQWALDRSGGIEAEGRPVALVTLRVDDPVPDPDRPGPGAIPAWLDMILRRDLGFLVPGSAADIE
ncbi:MAG: hypothetical protein GXY36_04860 [Chloroflexi bacterium]|nr:hypothetical protein [Chloroflexota bacterium]